MNRPFENKVVVVTGGSRGIGRAIVERFAAQGARVFFTYHQHEEPAQEVAAACGAEKIQCAQGDAAAIDAAVQHVVATAGKLDVLVNNAGITRDNLLMRMKDDEWQSVIDTNLGSVYRMSKACLRSMTKARKGRIINITSVVGTMGNAGQTNYAAAKAGMMGFTKSLAREVGSRAITVNCIAPGLIDTDMTRAMSEAQQKSILEAVPLGRFGQPEEIAQAVVFLASAVAGYITGETLHINGGMYMV